MDRRARIVPLALAIAALAAPAAGATTYVVTAENVVNYKYYDGSVSPSLRVSPTLPPGASIRGGVLCDRVFVPGSTSQTMTITRNLPVGTYQLVSSSCASRPSDPLELVGTSGSLQIVGGTHQVVKNPTRTVAAIAVAGLSGPDPAVAFSGQVTEAGGEGGTLVGEQIAFGYRRSDGFWLYDACTATVDSSLSGSCVLSDEQARRFAAGTGEWMATHYETRNFLGSGDSGRVGGTATDLTTAAANLQALIDDPGNQVTIVPTIVDPNCYKPRDDVSVSLLAVSLDQLSCGQIQSLQIVTGVVLGSIAPISGGISVGGASVSKVLAEVAYKAVLAGIAL